jgi:hypothetical protein
MNPAFERRVRAYRAERPHRGNATDLATFDAAVELVSACFALEALIHDERQAAIVRLRWAARRFMKAARARIKSKKTKKRVTR